MEGMDREDFHIIWEVFLEGSDFWSFAGRLTAYHCPYFRCYHQYPFIKESYKVRKL
jgi:hypothetical protein